MSFVDEPAVLFHFIGAADDELPFSEPLVVRGGIVSFASSFRTGGDLDGDLSFLKTLPLRNCWYGAADRRIQPFVCELGVAAQPTAREVLGALKVLALSQRAHPLARRTHGSLPWLPSFNCQ